MSNTGLFGRELTHLPNDKIWDCPKLKAFADIIISLTQKSKFVSGWIESIVENEENADCQNFLLSP